MRSGNNTFNKQHLYCLWNLPLFWLFKIGVTGNMKARLNEINETTFGIAVPLFWGKMFGAYYIEQFLLGITYPLKWELNGSGGTEWRIFGIITWPVMVLFWVFWKVFWFWVSLLLCWLLAGCPQEPIESFKRLFH